MKDVQEIITGIKNKKRRALARAISLTENQAPEVPDLIDAIFPLTGKAHYVGITGNPGSGKSSLVNELIRIYRSRGYSVAVLAVDPSSPLTGGAILGDRIRIDDSLLGNQVFFRSISNRNHLGGISATTFESLLLLDAYGFDVILIETVGTGQSETEIASLADTNLVVTVPGLGDDIQAEKAGLLEIADIFVVNKADCAGADKVKSQLESMLHLRNNPDQGQWVPPVLLTKAIKFEGIHPLVETISKHREYHFHHPKKEKMERILRQKIKEYFFLQMESRLDDVLSDLSEEVEEVMNRNCSHIQIARQYYYVLMQALSVRV